MPILTRESSRILPWWSESTKSVGDFSGDGRADALVYSTSFGFTPFYQATTGGAFSVTTPTEAYNWINLPQVTRLVGDFNGDGRADVLMTRPGWNSAPIYFGAAGGAFSWTNYAEASGYNLMNDAAAGKLVGDFNGDGKTDVALWRNGWGSTPVYFSNGDGSFRWTNYVTPTWINDPAARRIVGDFNGDGRSDILLMREGWGSNPVYFSNGNGSFSVTNAALPYNLANDPLVQPLVGDFNGDGRADIAMWRPGWNSTPIYLSNGDGTFTFTNYATSVTVNLMTTQKLVGDFDGDGKTDILMVMPGSRTATILYATGNGGWDTRSFSAAYLGGMGTDISVADFNADHRADFLVRRPGWTGTVTYFGSSTRGSMSAGVWNVGQSWIDQ
jgi:hypothetical protein